MRKVVIDPVRCPLTYEEFRLKEFEQEHNGSWGNETLDGNNHNIDTVRHAVADDVLGGECEAENVTDRARR